MTVILNGVKNFSKHKKTNGNPLVFNQSVVFY
jgi:hypothetical protein